MENIEQLILQAQDQDFAKAGNTFSDIMAQKMNDALDQERIKVSGQIYNGLEVDDEVEEEEEFEEDEVDAEDEADTDDADEDSDDD